jgi:CheY-like chemotaxis protein
MSQDTELLAGEPQEATKTILLVEEDPAISPVLVETRGQETPYRAIAATDGHAALQLVRHCTPDLFLLDDGLPGMNGIELYDRLHIDKALAAIPAILMTASRHVPQQQLRHHQLTAFKKPSSPRCEQGREPIASSCRASNQCSQKGCRGVP